jgi:hypothetical protein
MALIVVSVYATLAGRLVAAVWESLREGWENTAPAPERRPVTLVITERRKAKPAKHEADE